MKHLSLILIFMGLSMALFAQSVGINSDGSPPDASAILDVKSSTKGVLVPRLTAVERQAIRNPTRGLMVYDTDSLNFMYHNGRSWLAIKDDLGDHQATENIQLGSHYLSGDGDNEGIFVGGNGQVGIGTQNPNHVLDLGANTGRKLALYQDPTGDNFYGLGANYNNVQIFAGSTNANDAADMVVNSVNGYVGIGVRQPLHMLQLGGVLGRKLALFQNVRGTDFYGFGMDNGALQIHAGSEASEAANVVITNSDNVGIGTTTPHHTLDLGDTRGRKLAIYQNSTGTDFYGFGINANNMEFYAGSTSPTTNPLMVLNLNGNVGIGLPNPTLGKVHIRGGISASILAYAYLANTFGPANTPVTGRVGGATTNFSLYASDRIAASEFNARSDLRLKNIQGISYSEEDLATLMQIEITDYRLRDSIAKGQKPYKKVIAQQIAEVYPQAVTNDLTEVVPDIYQRAEVKDDWIMLATDLQIGEKVRLITEQGEELYEVREVEAERFQVSLPDSQKTSLSQIIFVYGREVDDFHTVDYEALSMLNLSATQEQQRLIEAQQKEIERLKKANQELKKSFEGRLQLLEASLEKPGIYANYK
ncbi:MAG: tail fiber domain-containing protein [Bacteroidota bacterium]